jgi:aspartate 1-decarboxylase
MPPAPDPPAYDRRMLRSVLHSKIHMATVTGASPDYMGSITIDADLLETVGLRVSDQVLIANCRNGARFHTYVFRGEPGSGIIEVNGAAAHLVEPGDKVIILHFAHVDDAEYAAHRPRVAIMRDDNTVERVMRYEPFGADPPGEVE